MQEFHQFPWIYPSIFSMILDECDGQSVLACRLVCSDWNLWISRTSVWSRLAPRREIFLKRLCRKKRDTDDEEWKKKWIIFHYRLNKLLTLNKIELSCEEQCMRRVLQMERYLTQANQNFTPPVDLSIFDQLRQLERMKSIRSLGPISIFIRCKVNHPVVCDIVKEIINRYMGCIVVDKKCSENPDLRTMIFQSITHGQNWILQYFTPEDAQAEPKAVVADLSTPSGRKRKQEEDMEGEAKRQKTGNSSGEERKEGKSPAEEEEEEEAVGDNLASLYTIRREEAAVRNFPTIQELLSIDHPLIEKLLVERSRIDRVLVVPDIEMFLFNQEKYPDLMNSDMEIVGRDSDGKVCLIDPRQFKNTDFGQLGYIDSPQGLLGAPSCNKLCFWGRTDMRNRWPGLCMQLHSLDKRNINQSGSLIAIDQNEENVGPSSSDSSRNGCLVSSIETEHRGLMIKAIRDIGATPGKEEAHSSSSSSSSSSLSISKVVRPDSDCTCEGAREKPCGISCRHAENRNSSTNSSSSSNTSNSNSNSNNGSSIEAMLAARGISLSRL